MWEVHEICVCVLIGVVTVTCIEPKSVFLLLLLLLLLLVVAAAAVLGGDVHRKSPRASLK